MQEQKRERGDRVRHRVIKLIAQKMLPSLRYWDGLNGPQHISRQVQREQLDFLAELNREHLAGHGGSSDLVARIKSYELAYRMQSATPEAVDLTEETSETLEMYGIGKQPTDEYGRNCLIARRLVERGVRFIQLYSGGGHLEETWDAHAGIESNHGRHAPEVDQPIAAKLLFAVDANC